MSKPRTKPYRNKPRRLHPLLVQGCQVLDCIEPPRQWLQYIKATGMVQEDAQGHVIMRHGRDFYHALPALQGLLVFCNTATRRGIRCPHRVLSRIVTRLHYHTPLTPADIAAGLDELTQLQITLMRLPPALLWDLQNSASIQCHLPPETQQ